MITFKKASVGLNIVFWTKLATILATTLFVIYAFSVGVGMSSGSYRYARDAEETLELMTQIFTWFCYGTTFLICIGYLVSGLDNGFFIAAFILSIIKFVLSLVSVFLNETKSFYSNAFDLDDLTEYFAATGISAIISIVNFALAFAAICCVCSGVKSLAKKLNNRGLASLAGVTRGFYITAYVMFILDIVFFFMAIYSTTASAYSRSYYSTVSTVGGIAFLFIIVLIIACLFLIVAGILSLIMHKSGANACKIGAPINQ